MTKHSPFEKDKKYYVCKTCGKTDEQGFPYWTFGRCFECSRLKAREQERKKRVMKPCKTCGKHFLQRTSMQGYCSNKCLGKKLSGDRQGRNNPAYRNGTRTGGKPVDVWKQRTFQKNADFIRKQMVDKFGFLSCQVCGTSNTLRWEVHHVVYRSEAPRHANLHSIDNLLICCIQCHNDLHSNKKLRRKIVSDRKLWQSFPEILSLQNEA